MCSINCAKNKRFFSKYLKENIEVFLSVDLQIYVVIVNIFKRLMSKTERRFKTASKNVS